MCERLAELEVEDGLPLGEPPSGLPESDLYVLENKVLATLACAVVMALLIRSCSHMRRLSSATRRLRQDL